MNRSAGQTNRVNREEPRRKDTHSLYLQCLQQGLFLKFSEKSYEFKLPTVTGTFDVLITAHEIRPNGRTFC